jgi:STAS-like domain of unknown function (DUF4325)
MVNSIKVRDIAGRADTADQGAMLYRVLLERLDRPGQVIVDFDGLTTATSSFCNLAFVQLLARWKLADLKKRLRVVNSTRQINEMVRSRLEREGKSAAA